MADNMSYEDHKPRQQSQDNTEKRFIHIQDPSTYNKGRPIDEAVNTAFNDAHVKDVAGISPELIAQITQNVIKQLQTTGIPETPVTAIPPPRQTQQQQSPESPSAHSSGSPPPRIFTPPSPQKHSETHDAYAERTTKDPTSPTRSFRSTSNLSSADESMHRPRAPIRQPTVEEETTLERIWGKLFDEEGKATPRLSQFLRGLAVHLIEDSEPKQSIVVTPVKMVQFYETTKISRDIYPWNDIFDDSQSSISRMYRELRIQHHLVQDEDSFGIRPDIPGLTAKGFEKWQTLMILAHPDEEFERLQIAALHMPINNPDDKKERFPKEISRKLFPKIARTDIRNQLIDAIETHAKLDIPRKEDTLTPRAEYPPSRRRRSATVSHEGSNDEGGMTDGPYLRTGNERERRSFHRIPPESAIDDSTTPTIPVETPRDRSRASFPRISTDSVIDDSTHTLSTPIERERKPYSAAPGGGKVYNDSDASLNGNPPGLTRSTSTSSRPINIPPPPPKGPTVHRMSASEYATSFGSPHQPPHLREPRRRNQSPMGNDMRRSDTDLRKVQSSSYDSPSYMPREGYPPPPPGPPQGQYPQSDPRYEDDRRYGRERDIRREDYARGGSPNRRGAVDEDFYRRREQPPRNW